MAIRGELKGAEELSRQLQRYGQAVVREAEKVVARAALNIRLRAINKIQKTPATGTTYFREPGTSYMTVRAGGPDGPPVAFVTGGGAQNLSAVHRASSPGQPPASDTGTLASQIDAEIRGLSARVGTNVEYGAHLEFGTHKMAERPWLYPSVREEQGPFRQDMINTINGIKP